MVFRTAALNRVVQIIADARSSADRVWDLLDQPLPPSAAEPTSGTLPTSDTSNSLPPGDLRLRAEAVSVQVRGETVLHDCSIEIASGEVVALVGPTGCGKSTLMQVLAQLRQPDQGAVVLSDAYGRQHDAAAIPRRGGGQRCNWYRR